MTPLLKTWLKSTFIATSLCLISGVAQAQFGRGQKSTKLPTPRGIDEIVQIYSTHPTDTTGDLKDNLYTALKAQNVASMIKAGDLTADWHMVSEDSSRYFNQNDLFYTKGDTFLFGNEQFLVVYHIVNPSDPNERDALDYYFDEVDQRNSRRTTPRLLKSLQLALSLFPISRIKELHEIAVFNPQTDLADKPPKVLLNRGLSQSNLKQIALGVMMYTQDYDEMFPPMVAGRSAENLMSLPSSKTTSVPTVQNLLQPYLKSTEIFLHPVTRRPYLPNYKISRKSMAEIDSPSTTFLFFEDAPDTEGMRNVAYADGHVKAISEAEFQLRRKAQGISESGYPSAAKPTPKP